MQKSRRKGGGGILCDRKIEVKLRTKIMIKKAKLIRTVQVYIAKKILMH